MKHRPLVSVIVPTRNPSGLLTDALNSVYAQTGRCEQFDVEVVVVDDGSVHPQHECHGLPARYPGLRYIQLPEQRGQSAARNVGIRAATGSFIAFLDDDDLWLPWKLARQLPVLRRNLRAGVVYNPIIVRVGDRDQIFPGTRQAPSGWVLRELCKDLFIGNPLSVLVRQEVLELAGLFDEALPALEDYDLWLRLAFHTPFCFSHPVVAVYRRSPGGTFFSRSRRGAGEMALRKIFANMTSWLPDTERYAVLRQQLPGWRDLQIAKHWGIMDDLDRMRECLMQALECHPWLAEDATARRSTAEMMRKLALASTSPLQTARAFEASFTRTTVGASTRRRWAAHRLIGEVWAEVAMGLAFHKRPPASMYAARAAVEAIIHDSSRLTHGKLLWIVGQMPIRLRPRSPRGQE